MDKILRASGCDSVEELENRLGHFLLQIQACHVRTPTSKPKIQHWDHRTNALAEWSWPIEVETGRRVFPSELQEHKRSHTYLNPCCLCAYLLGVPYVESRVGIVEIVQPHQDRDPSILNGEYVATCANNGCGYFVCLERFYPLVGIKVKAHPKRSKPLPAEELARITHIDNAFRGGDGLFQIMPAAILERGSKQGLKVEDLSNSLSKHHRRNVFANLALGLPEHSSTDEELTERGQLDAESASGDTEVIDDSDLDDFGTDDVVTVEEASQEIGDGDFTDLDDIAAMDPASSDGDMPTMLEILNRA
ncbi:hypothetical protein MD484_g9052, partial [Candolleomyces efflorescens]